MEKSTQITLLSLSLSLILSCWEVIADNTATPTSAAMEISSETQLCTPM